MEKKISIKSPMICGLPVLFFCEVCSQEVSLNCQALSQNGILKYITNTHCVPVVLGAKNTVMGKSQSLCFHGAHDLLEQ